MNARWEQTLMYKELRADPNLPIPKVIKDKPNQNIKIDYVSADQSGTF